MRILDEGHKLLRLKNAFLMHFFFSSCFLMVPVHNLVQGLIYCIINLYNNPILANKTKATKYGIRNMYKNEVVYTGNEIRTNHFIIKSAYS